jgi:hypothetical protein
MQLENYYFFKKYIFYSANELWSQNIIRIEKIKLKKKLVNVLDSVTQPLEIF